MTALTHIPSAKQSSPGLGVSFLFVWLVGGCFVCVFRKRQKSAPLLWQRLFYSCGQKGSKSGAWCPGTAGAEGAAPTFPHPVLSLGHSVHT